MNRSRKAFFAGLAKRAHNMGSDFVMAALDAVVKRKASETEEQKACFWFERYRRYVKREVTSPDEP